VSKRAPAKDPAKGPGSAAQSAISIATASSQAARLRSPPTVTAKSQ
jgi:hypothetical protein